jgi:putative phosphoesterase
MKLGYISDLHIDINERYNVFDALIFAARENHIDALAIAGDTSNSLTATKNFFNALYRNLGIPIYSINGNHEFYNQGYTNDFHSDYGVMVSDNTILLATTGWYDYTWDSVGRVAELKKGKSGNGGRWSDHRWIDWEDSKDIRKGQDPAIWYTNQCRDRLLDLWENSRDVKNTIVMTHMVPHISLLQTDPGYYATNPFFGSATMQSLIFDTIKPNTVIYGHTHFANETKIGNTLCTCRPVGYAGYEWNDLDRRMNTIFDVLEVE